MNEQALLRAVKEAGQRRAELTRELDRATGELVAAIRAAERGGVSLSRIGRELKLSRQRVAQLRGPKED
jgi:hypothetical protein